MKTGEKIRTIRSLKGLSQENMAEMMGMSRLAYGDIERNKSSISKERLNQISQALGVSVEDIEDFGETVANFFDQCNSPQVNAGSNNSNSQNNNYDKKEILHQLEIAKIEIEKLKVELEKANIEVELWKLKSI